MRQAYFRQLLYNSFEISSHQTMDNAPSGGTRLGVGDYGVPFGKTRPLGKVFHMKSLTKASRPDNLLEFFLNWGKLLNKSPKFSNFSH